MNLLKNLINITRQRSIQSMSTRSIYNNPLIREILTERSLIRVHGDEVVSFLQGLITNDMNHFDNKAVNSIYAMFLNKNGRILHDSIIYKPNESNTFYIEIDKSGSNNLCRHLRIYCVRRKIHIDNIDNDYKVLVLYQNEIHTDDVIKNKLKIDKTTQNDQMLICYDPRLKTLGTRLILPKSISNSELKKLLSLDNLIESTIDYDYQVHRYKLGVSEGIQEHQYNKILPFETNIDYLHGVSFHKGCYLGQELTARTYHTGVIRKRIMPIKLKKPIDNNNIQKNNDGVIETEVKTSNGISCGKIKGIKNNYCIAVLNVEKAMQSAEGLTINNEPCHLIVPDWWPKELPNKMKLKNKTKLI